MARRKAHLYLLMICMALGVSGCVSQIQSLDTLTEIPFPADRAASFTAYGRLGNDTFSQSSGGTTVQGNSLLLSGPGVAYAVYQFTPLSAPDHIDITLGAGTSAAYIAIADYSRLRWDFGGPISSSLTLPVGGGNVVSPLGNVYLVVAVGGSDSAKIDQLSLLAANVVPVAAFTADVSAGDAPLTVNFDASTSNDPDGSLVQYQWDFDGDSVYETDGGTIPTIQHIFAAAGVYAVSVQVTDDGGGQAASPSQTINTHGWAVVLVRGGGAYYPTLADSGGVPAIGSWDGGAVAYSRSSTPLGAAAADWTTLAVTSDSGGYTSFAQIAGNPAFSFYRFSTKELQFLRSDTADGLQPADWGAPAVVATGDADTFGYYTSLAEINGSPAIAYTDMFNGTLEYARANTATGTQSSDWVQQAQVDSATAQGYRPHLAATGNGNPAIAYRDVSLLGYAYSTSPDGAQAADWALVNPVAGSNAVYMTMTTVAGTPAIGYLDSNDYTLRYARSTTATGASAADWTQQFSVLSLGVGWPGWMAVAEGRPAYGYFDGNDEHMKFIGATTADGAAQGDWTDQSVIDPVGTAGQENSFAEIAGRPAVCYSQGTGPADNNLYYAILL